MFGITEENFNYLLSNEARDIIDREINSNPAQLALRGVRAVVCNQIKYLQKCRYKLPHLYDVRGIIPPLSYEQSSSYHTSASRKYSGERVLDLTCGLGVDAYFLSKNFDSVITLEREELLARVATENFKRLGATNIEVVNISAKEYLDSYIGEKFDMIYIDPARRDDKRKIFLLEDCSPNIVELLPRMKELAKKVVIKLSPLFDRAEAERILGRDISLRAISVGGECKELVIEIEDGSVPHIYCDIIDRAGRVVCLSFNTDELNNKIIKASLEMEKYRYVSLPDVSLRKMRCVEDYFVKYFKSDCFYYDNELALSSSKPNDFAGRVYEIEKVISYKPKLFKREKIKEATVITYNFRYSAEDIYKTLGLKNRGSKHLIFTNINNESLIIFVKL